jgi:hypothetical protein
VKTLVIISQSIKANKLHEQPINQLSWTTMVFVATVKSSIFDLLPGTHLNLLPHSYIFLGEICPILGQNCGYVQR